MSEVRILSPRFELNTQPLLARMIPDNRDAMEGERTREPALGWRPSNWHESRKRPVHCVIPSADRATVVYITICTKDREQWLADPEVHAQLITVWSEAKAWLVGRYVIMPDHIHLFAGWAGGEIMLETWVRYWKRLFSLKHGKSSHKWQSGHWDTTMRTMKQCEEKWEYVLNNPVRHKLVEKAEDWPYAGIVHDFVWP